MTEIERALCTDYREIRRADICLLAIESYYRKTGDNGTAKEIYKFRQRYLNHFMVRIRNEQDE